jgi:hypothetical protein
VWACLFNYGRYFIPTEVILSVPIAILISKLIPKKITMLFFVPFCFVVLSNPWIPNWSGASSDKPLNTQTNRWNSELSRELQDFHGTLLTSGSPTSFISIVAPNVTSIVKIDFGPLPMPVRNSLEANLRTSKSIKLLDVNDLDNIESRLPGLIPPFLWDRIKVENCVVRKAPIKMIYTVCTFAVITD